MDLKDLTREQVIEFGSNSEVAKQLCLDYEDTTIERNGYPRNINQMIVSGSIETLNNLADKLVSLGFDVEKYELHKKDGWHIWNRTSIAFFDKGNYQIVNDQDYTFDYDPAWTEAEAKKNISEDITECIDMIEILYKEMSYAKKPTKYFLDENNNYAIEYGVCEDQANYSYDTNHYQLAIRIEDFEES